MNEARSEAGLAMIQAEISSILINELSDEQVITLNEVDGSRSLSIVVRLFEALQLDRIVQQRDNQRPLTHDLFGDALSSFGIKLKRVRIDHQEDDIYHATLELENGEQEHELDARPSDALALALTKSAPIFVGEELFDGVLEEEKTEES